MVVPSAKVLPEAGTHVGVIEPSTISKAVAVKVATAPAADVASAVTGAGAVTAGGVVSCTSTVNEPEAVLLWASVVEQ